MHWFSHDNTPHTYFQMHDAYYMHIECILLACRMHTRCILHAHSIHKVWALHTCSIHTGCILHTCTYCINTECILHIHITGMCNAFRTQLYPLNMVHAERNIQYTQLAANSGSNIFARTFDSKVGTNILKTK